MPAYQDIVTALVTLIRSGLEYMHTDYACIYSSHSVSPQGVASDNCNVMLNFVCKLLS